jgi:hypothetical protein
MTNPYLEPTNYFDGYKQQFDAMNSRKGRIEVDALVHTVFSTEAGMELLELIKDRFISAATPSQINEHYATSCVYYEGYRAAFRYLITLVESYKIRKEHEAEANLGTNQGVEHP